MGLKVGSPVNSLSITWELITDAGSWGPVDCFEILCQVILMQLRCENH